MDNGCTVTFNDTNAIVKQHDKVLWMGTRHPYTGLWMVPLSSPSKEIQKATSILAQQANAITLPTKVPELIQFSHAALFSPTISTLQKAVDKGYITKFPGLNSKALTKYPPQSVAMHKGHLDQQRANLQSTKPVEPVTDEDILYPQPLEKGLQTNFCYATIFNPFDQVGKIFTDQTGKFPHTSLWGNQYVFVLYAYDPNYIAIQPMRNKSATSILEAYKQAHAQLVRAGLKPMLQCLDNECSQILKEFITEQEIDFQLVPPGIHRRNSAERAIRTFKNHFIAGLCSTDPKFPLNLWCRLLPQAEITLNLLRGSRMNPKLSAYAQVNGPFDYNRTPLAPPGIRVLVHEKPSNRGSWDPHGIDGWYIGPAMDSYRCFKTYIWKTKGERISDTLEWFPHWVKMPTSSNMDLLVATTKDILTALESPPYNSPLSPLTDSEYALLKEFSNIFHKHATEPIVEIQSKTVETDPAPPLRVAEEPNPAPLLRVPTTNSPGSPPLQRSPHIIPLETGTTPTIVNNPEHNNTLEPQVIPPDNPIPPLSIPTSTTPDPPEGYYKFMCIKSHKPAPIGCGSSFEVEVEWEGHSPSFVPINDFTEHLTNEAATKACTEYAQKNNLLDTRGWKQFKTYNATHVNRPATFHITHCKQIGLGCIVQIYLWG